jgi:5-formyltetrahydrofolate cyclo-ligase
VNKADTRRELIARRLSLDSQDVALWGASIVERLIQTLPESLEGVVHVYTSHQGWNEVDTSLVMERLTAMAPAISLVTSSHSIAAPQPVGTFQLIIVPILGFDETCSRIGMGAGWYDQFLASQPQALKIGLAFERQKNNIIPVEDHDVKLDMIVTERVVYSGDP